MSLQIINMEKIAPNTYNERTVKKDDPEIVELSKSIRSVGLIEPIVVRSRKTMTTDYEIVCGERRFIASKLVGSKTIACNIVTADDKTAREMNLVENLQRKDLQPLEAARIINRMRKDGNNTIQIAEHIGKPVQWVAKRGNLINLNDNWRKAMEKNEYSGWGILHYELIARYDEKTQDELSRQYKYGADGMSIKDLLADLENYMLTLSKAPFIKQDETISAKINCTACSKCPNRTGLQVSLFDEFKSGDDRCLNSECYRKKTNAFLAIKEAEIAKKGEKYIIISEDRGASEDYEKRAVQEHKTKKVKKTEPGAVQALIVSGPNTGVVQWRKMEDWATTGKTKGSQQPKTLAERKKDLDARRTVMAVKSMMAYLGKTLVNPETLESLDFSTITGLATTFGVKSYRDVMMYEQTLSNSRWKHHNKNKDISLSIKVVELAKLIIPKIQEVLKNSIAYNKREKETIDNVTNLSEIFFGDCDKFILEAKEKIKEPKAWANIETDGSPKKDKKEPKKAKVKRKGLKDINGKKKD